MSLTLILRLTLNLLSQLVLCVHLREKQTFLQLHHLEAGLQGKRIRLILYRLLLGRRRVKYWLLPLLLLLVLFLARVIELLEEDFFLEGVKTVWLLDGEVISQGILGLDNNGLRVRRRSQIFNGHNLKWLMRVLLEQR